MEHGSILHRFQTMEIIRRLNQIKRHCAAIMYLTDYSESYIPWFFPCLPPPEVDPPVFVPEQHCCCCTSFLILPSVQRPNKNPTLCAQCPFSTPKAAAGNGFRAAFYLMQRVSSGGAGVSGQTSSRLSFLTCTSFLFTAGGSSKALWYKRSYNTVLEMSQTSHTTSQPLLMKRLSAKALRWAFRYAVWRRTVCIL